MPDVDAPLDELLDVLSAKSIIGKPIKMKDEVIIPVTNMGLGFGTDIGQRGTDTSKESLTRRGACGAVGLFPVAVVIVFKGITGPDGVKVVPLYPPGESTSSIAHIVMEKIMGHKENRKKRAENMVAIEVE